MTTPIAVEEQVTSQQDEDKSRIQSYYSRFVKASTAVAPMHRKFTVLDMFDRGEQWKDANVPPWVPKPVTNLIRYVRTIKRANLASSIPMCHYSPLSIEDTDFIKRLSDAYKHVWQWEKVPRIVRRGIDRANLHGTSIAYVYEDSSYVGGKYYGKSNAKNQLFQGKLCVKLWPSTNFFPDPDAYRIQDGKFHETTEIMPLNSVKRNPKFRKYIFDTYGKKQGELFLSKLKGDNLDREDTADGTVLNRDTKPGEGAGSIHGDELATVHCHWERYINESGAWQLDVSYYLRGNDFFLYRAEDIKPSKYPFAVYYDEEEDQDFWGTSEAMNILENQKVINKTAQVAAIIATLHQNPQKVVSRASGINAQEMARTGTLPGKVWTSNEDPMKSVHHLQPADIPKGLFEMEDRMKNDIKDMAGITEAYTGTSVGSLTTSTGVNSLIERATIRDKDKMIQVDQFVEDISDLIVHFILHKWQDKRPLAINQPDGSTMHTNYEPIPGDVADNLEWTVRCDTYAVAPMTQALKKQQADNLMQMQGQFNYQPALITPQEWIKMQDFEDKEEMLSRMQKDAEIIAKQQQQQTPKINPNGDIQIALSTKDPSIISATLNDMMQQAYVQQQEATDLMMNHVNNGVNVAPGTGAAPAAQQAQAPAGPISGQAAANMNRGS
jgi:hypothetical protein